MSIIYEQFTVEASLQHMTMVRISQHLLRITAPQVEHLLLDYPDYSSSLPDVFERWWENQKPQLFSKMNVILSQTVKTLCLPEKLKEKLSYYMISMGIRMFRCLSRMQRDMIETSDPNCLEKLSYFIKNFSWDNFGCIDAKKLVDSYVKNKRTIDFSTFMQLCTYFSEDNIRKFARRIDWDAWSKYWIRNRASHEVRVDYASFWYYLLYKNISVNYGNKYSKIFPTRAWTTRPLYWAAVKDDNISAIKYLKNERDSGLTFTGSREELEMSESYVYRVGQIRDLREKLYGWPFGTLKEYFYFDWPWIFCVYSWKKIFRVIGENPQVLAKIMVNTLERIKARREIRFKEFPDIHQCEIFEEMWDVWCETASFRSPVDLKIIHVGWLVLQMKDIQLCKVVFKDGKTMRRKFLAEMGKHCSFGSIGEWNSDFWQEFREEVIPDNERNMFREMFRQNVLRAKLIENYYLGL